MLTLNNLNWIFLENFFSLYHGLWINGPKEAGIELPDFPFDAETPSYFKADRMLKYLRDYVTHKGCDELIHCSRNVDNIQDWSKLIFLTYSVQNSLSFWPFFERGLESLMTDFWRLTKIEKLKLTLLSDIFLSFLISQF